MLIDTRSVQRFLAAHGAAILPDGDWGDISDRAGRAYLASLAPALTSYQTSWPAVRVRTAIEQAMIGSIGADVGRFDGIAGVRTQVGLERWQDHITFRPPLADHEVAYQKPIWPRQHDMISFYGHPGENQTELVSPYPLYLDWALNDKISKFSIHEKCHDSALRVMGRVLSAYGLAEIHRLGLDQFGGCLNVRKMRNGSSWSIHSWGAAIDWDADRNQLRETSRTARMAQPDYARFLDLWEEEGWTSLGRARNFDWMHVQAARL